ncbi:MAG: NADH-quinone oxidoreductase subunit J [Dehalococcoidia bacterium]|nr:NADH-quinone oxidoreductase subunit J [Dehalococcoidia bacterium]
MTGIDLAFYVLAGFSIAGGLGLAVTRSVVHGALFLILALMGVGGVFFTLLADFLALVQVLLYAGGVTILMLFAMMLTQVREQPEATNNPQRPWAALASLAFFGAVTATIVVTPWPRNLPEGAQHVEFVDIAGTLFTRWAVPFEIASLLLLVALIGAIIVAREATE